jgi:hypothetical protein
MPFLGLDIGTSATKALHLSDHGKVTAAARVPLMPFLPVEAIGYTKLLGYDAQSRVAKFGK